MKARQERDAPASRRLQAEVDALRQAVNAAKAARAAAQGAARSASPRWGPRDRKEPERYPHTPSATGSRPCN
jgi:hypothetical protein